MRYGEHLGRSVEGMDGGRDWNVRRREMEFEVKEVWLRVGERLFDVSCCSG